MIDYCYQVAGVGITLEFPLHAFECHPVRGEWSWRFIRKKRSLTRRQHRHAPFFYSRHNPDGTWCVGWPREGLFWIDPDRRHVTYQLATGISSDAFLDMLVGPVVSYLLLFDGYHPLHGSAVCRDNRAICFLGHSGAGKSTIAATLIQSGYDLIDDDVLTVGWRRGRPCAIPGYPEIRLWPASGRNIVPDYGQLPKVIPTSSKRRLDPRTTAGGFARSSLILHLAGHVHDSSASGSAERDHADLPSPRPSP